MCPTATGQSCPRRSRQPRGPSRAPAVYGDASPSTPHAPPDSREFLNPLRYRRVRRTRLVPTRPHAGPREPKKSGPQHRRTPTWGSGDQEHRRADPQSAIHHRSAKPPSTAAVSSPLTFSPGGKDIRKAATARLPLPSSSGPAQQCRRKDRALMLSRRRMHVSPRSSKTTMARSIGTGRRSSTTSRWQARTPETSGMSAGRGRGLGWPSASRPEREAPRRAGPMLRRPALRPAGPARSAEGTGYPPRASRLPRGHGCSCRHAPRPSL